jgi:VWFA-related protein
MRPAKPILLALTLTLTLTAHPQQKTPSIQVVAREVVLDVTITDNQGNPVHNLKQEDFTVKEDNKLQPIRSFHEYSAQTVPPPRQLPPNVYTNLQPPPASSAVNLILLDGLNTAPADASEPSLITSAFTVQTLVKQEAKKFLQTMPPGTQVAILGLSRNLRVLQGVTSNPALLSAAVDTMDMNLDGRASTPDQWCVQQVTRNRATLEALSQIAADAASIQGRKNLIWFSAGLPTVTDPSVNVQVRCNMGFNLQGAGVKGPAFQLIEPLPNLLPDLQKTYSLLAAAEVTIFPIAPYGLGSAPNPIGLSPSHGGSGSVAPGLVGPGDDMWANINLSLESIAEATGGAAYYNTNDLAGAVAKAVEKGANFYTISYVPPSKTYDYGHHNIKIEVHQPNLHLVYRKVYDNIDPATIKPPPALTLATTYPAITDTPDPGSMRAAMSRSMPTSGQLLFTVEVAPSTEEPKPTDPPIFGTLDPALAAVTSKKPLTRYGIAYGLPARQLTFAAPTGPHPGANRKASLEFDLAAYDAEGKLITSLSQSIQPTLTDAQYQQLLKGPFRFFQQLDLPPGALFLRIGILDATSTKLGTVEIPLTVLKKVVIKDMANPPPPRFDAP